MLLLVIHKVVGQQQTDQCCDEKIHHIICEDAIYSQVSISNKQTKHIITKKMFII